VAKLKVDTYKWAAQVNAPDEYSGKIESKDHTKNITIRINTGITRPGDDDYIEIKADEKSDK